jgi:hypothetical protein
MTSLAIIQLTAEEDIWLGDLVATGTRSVGEVVALAPKPGHVWVCDGHTFHEALADPDDQQAASL